MNIMIINTRNFLISNNINSTINKLHTKTSKYYDIIIAGGGLVGTTLAASLGKKKELQHKSILLLEGSKESVWSLTDKYSNRVVAITPASQKLLESINAWNIIKNVRYGSVKRMQIWDSLSDAMITFENESFEEHVAYIVENNLLLHAVSTVAKDLPNVTIKYESKWKDFVLPNEEKTNTEVHMANEETYTCNLLIGADGYNSLVRKKMGSQYVNWNYNQKGIVATLNLAEDSNNIVAWQRWLPTGPLAILPLNDSKSSLVWTADNEFAKKLMDLSEEEFIDELNRALWSTNKQETIVQNVTKYVNSFLENLKLPSNAVRQLPPNIKSIEPGSRAAFPLGFGHSTNYIAKGVAIVGDAAHRVHPLAGLGLNLGLGDVECITDVLAEAIYCGRDIGSLIHLNQYQTTRQRQNVPTMVAIEGLQKLYCTDIIPVVLLRTVGLQVTHAMTPVKNFIMNFAKN